MTGPQAFRKVTVNLIPAAWDAAGDTADRLSLTRTDVINRALQAYAFLEEQIAAGAAVQIRHPDGTVTEVRFLLPRPCPHPEMLAVNLRVTYRAPHGGEQAR